MGAIQAAITSDAEVDPATKAVVTTVSKSLVWAPDANPGPLLGIFVTGLIGFVIGTALG